jgi:hypothetical protein
MIPIVTISSIVLLFFLLFITYRIYLSYGKKKSKAVGYFMKAFVSMIAFQLVFIPNGIWIKDLKIISFLFNLTPFFHFLSIAFFTAITFEIMGKQFLKKIVFIILTVYGFVMTIIPIISLKPAL